MRHRSFPQSLPESHDWFYVMCRTILVTSFTTWKSHQPSNSSDDLLELISRHPDVTRSSLHFLRKVPVHFSYAPSCVIHHIQTIEPDIVICCGMSEKHQTMNIESRAIRAGQIQYTGVDLVRLVDGLKMTRISHNAGRYVCNSLYFDVLDFLRHYHKPVLCIFVHVPRLSLENQAWVVSDFLSILHRMESLPVSSIPICAPV
ncbi:MAG: peptidase C15 [Leptolyngbyaceae bacterium]|nr:peptidase C15 [Leptolyngbyaceae bacterium]